MEQERRTAPAVPPTGDPRPPVAGDRTEQAVRRELDRSAQQHYLRGNRFFETAAWDRALEEWRRASGLWGLARASGRLVARRLIHLRAALALLATVAALYVLIFSLFPRDPFEMFMISGAGGFDDRPWWQRFLDNGRPQSEEGHKLGLREWWERMRRGMGGEEQGQVARRLGGRPPIDARWEELLRRYGRWGPFFNSELDYNVIAGYGLSRMGDYAGAVEVFQRGIEQARSPERLADLYQGLANAHYYQGYLLQPSGLAQYDLQFVRKSTEAYEQSVRYQPRAVSYGNLGWMYFLLGDYTRSERMSRRALDLDGGLEYVRLNLGLTHLLQGHVRDAFEVYRYVIRRNPPNEVLMGGINDLREVLRDREGRLPFGYLMVGILALKQGDYTLAKDALGRFNVSPLVGPQWRELGQRLLQDLSTAEIER